MSSKPFGARYRTWRGLHVLVCGLLALLLLNNASAMLAQDESVTASASSAPFDAPTTSSPITLSQDKNFIWVVNSDGGSVSVLGDLGNNPRVLKTIPNVGREPQAVALDTANHAYVVSPPNNGVFVVDITSNNVNTFNAVARKEPLITGAEPWNLVASPDGSRIFVANSGQDTITVIRTDTQSVVGSVDLKNSLCNVDDQNRHFQPRGLAVTLDNKRLYVARFLSFTKPGGVQGKDGDKEGVVCQLNINPNLTTLPTVASVVRMAAMDSGFAQPDGKPAISHPNQLQSIVIYRDQVYLPNIGAATAGPDRFNSSTMAHVNVLDNANAGAPADAPTKAINLHLGARAPEPGKKKLFFANPWAIGFRNKGGTVNAYAVSAGSDLLVKLNVDATGDLTFTVAANSTRYIDLNDPNNTNTSGRNGGKNPLGIVIRDNKAFVMNLISRNVSVVNLDTDAVEKVIETTALPPANSFDEQLHVGKEIFFSSRGHFDRPNGATVSTDERLSSEGWQNCASCHFGGNTDGNVWFFGSGPRKSIPLNATWSPHNPTDQRLLNYSAIFDEVQDFENNIRNTSGPNTLVVQGKPPAPCAFLPSPPAAPNTVGTTPIFDPNHGLLFGDDGDVNKTVCQQPNFIPIANAGRQQLSVTLPGSNKAWPALDSLKEWVRFAIRTPEGMLTTAELGNGNATGGLNPNTVKKGRNLFFQAGCQLCHGGAKWTNSNKDFISPPSAAELAVESPANVTGASQLEMFNRVLRDIGSFNLNVLGQNNAIPGQPEIGAVEVNNAGVKALGFDHNGDGRGGGYNVPALLGIWQLPPYYHNGACQTLNCVLANPKHRTAGLRPGQSDPLANSANQAALVEWLKTLDADTPFPFDLEVRNHDIFLDPPTPFKGTTVQVGVNVSLFGTKADLQDLLQDLGLGAIKVRIEANPGLPPTDVDLLPDAFNQDFGQAVVSTTWNIPADAVGSAKINITVDPENQLLEEKENNNNAKRQVNLRNQPNDNTAPVINRNDVLISDEDPFNVNDPITQSPDVRVQFKAIDPTGSNGAQPSGVDSYCLVTYYYDTVSRRWVEAACSFQKLPAPSAADTFVVNAKLPDRAGAAYGFVWVKDSVGNISRTPGFDTISFAPNAPINLDRNDVRIFRIPLAAGQNLKLTFTPEFGDVDVAVFADFTSPRSNQIANSANNGLAPEEVTLTGPGNFQVQVKAVVNSRFTIAVGAAADVEIAAASAAMAAAEATVDNAAAVNATLLVGGPPALRTAIGDDQSGAVQTIYFPLINK